MLSKTREHESPKNEPGITRKMSLLYPHMLFVWEGPPFTSIV